MTLPPVVIKLLSLEFRNIVADFMFVRASQFYGGKVEKKEASSRDDWEWLYRNLDVVTELDPYFQDPYYMGNGLLTWDAEMYKEANSLLQKGTDKRTWDWWLPFLMGFNKFYFLGDNKGGADDLLLASERPGAWPILPQLASRLYYSEGKTGTAISFLTAFWENERDENVRRGYEVRIEALKRILFLEEAVKRYREKTGETPKKLKQLLDEGVISDIPADPYGGAFYLDPAGAIKTTSKLAFPAIK